MKKLAFYSVLFFFAGFLQLFSSQFLISKVGNNNFIITVDHNIHIKYGFLYPVTYDFEISPNSRNLSAFIKYKKNADWNQLVEKTPHDFFNGINAVRFDYPNNKAYLSVAFNANSDTIFLKISDNINNSLVTNFVEVCKYYDNRKSVVCTSADDLNKWYNDGFKKAFYEFRRRNLWLSCGVVTQHMDPSSWQYIQQQLDSGFVEMDSHSRNHEWPYPDVTAEVAGSREDIVKNLNLPPFYNSGNKEYVYSLIYPFGSWTIDIDLASGNYGYLINRTVVSNQWNFTNWSNQFNMYNRVGVVYEVGPVYDGVSGISDINLLKNTFDNVTNAGAVYHFSIHPNNIGSHGDWNLPYLYQLLDYISNRKNLWYVGFGTLYTYHYVADNISFQTVSEYLSVNSNNINFDSNGGSSDISIYSNTPWHVNENIDWISVTPLNGNNDGIITVTCDSNPEVTSREANFTISGNNISQSVIVHQNEKKYLEVNPSNIQVSNDSSTIQLQIYSNTDWHIDENVDWISVSPLEGNNNGVITLSCDFNPEVTFREATFNISDNSISQTVTVHQNEKKYLEVNPSNIQVSNDSSTIQLQIYSNTNWHFEENIDWISLSADSGNHDSKILLHIDLNNNPSFRESSFLLTDDEINLTLNVKQDAKKFLYLSLKSIELQEDSSSFSFIVNSNDKWKIYRNKNWIFPNKDTCNLSDTVTVSYSKNLSEIKRSARIIILSNVLTDTLNITQIGTKYFEINVTVDSTMDGGIVKGTGKYMLGDTVTLTAIPHDSWQFKGWFKDSLLVSTDSIFTFTANSELNLIAKFKEILTGLTETNTIPYSFNLFQNYPNPFNPTTIIKYSLPNGLETNLTSTTNVQLKIYDVLGHEIETLVNEQKRPGIYEVNFNANNLSSGIYYYQIKAGNFIQTKKMLLIK